MSVVDGGFAGIHDFIGGYMSGLYDEQGNAIRGMANLVNTATNGMGTVQYSTHATDLVGSWIGGNPATGGLDSYSFPDSHSSYFGYLPPEYIQNGDTNKLRILTDKAWGYDQINQPQVVEPTN